MFKQTFYEALKEILGEGADAKLGGGKADGPISEIIFNDETGKPTDDEVNIKLSSMISEFDAQAYARNRATEFPAIGDQLDYIFHNGVAKWKTDMIEPVKAKYPKPE